MNLATMQRMRLVSPALPICSFAHSRGMENAVHCGRLHDEPSDASWKVGPEDAAAADKIPRTGGPGITRSYMPGHGAPILAPAQKGGETTLLKAYR